MLIPNGLSSLRGHIKPSQNGLIIDLINGVYPDLKNLVLLVYL
jgi:hypothetical protein